MRLSLLIAVALCGPGCGDDNSGGDHSLGDLARFDSPPVDRAVPADQAQSTGDQAAPDDLSVTPPDDGAPPPPPPDDGGPPRVDGGGCLTNTDCPNANDYCQFFVTPGCNGPGACVQKPQLCPQIVFPVCGCDNMTYQNSCYAAKAGENIKTNMMCN